MATKRNNNKITRQGRIRMWKLFFQFVHFTFNLRSFPFVSLEYWFRFNFRLSFGMVLWYENALLFCFFFLVYVSDDWRVSNDFLTSYGILYIFVVPNTRSQFKCMKNVPDKSSSESTSELGSLPSRKKTHLSFWSYTRQNHLLKSLWRDWQSARERQRPLCE